MSYTAKSMQGTGSGKPAGTSSTSSAVASKFSRYKNAPITVGPVLGRGAFGIVRLGVVVPDQDSLLQELEAKQARTGTSQSAALAVAEGGYSTEGPPGIAVALKEIPLSSWKGIAREVLAMLRCGDHKNVLQLCDLRRLDPDLESPLERAQLVLEYASGGSLTSISNAWAGILTRIDDDDYDDGPQPIGIPEYVVRRYTLELLQGLAYIHGKGVAHCDIKGSNLLLSSDGRVLLSDFGSCYIQRMATEKEMQFLGVLQSAPLTSTDSMTPGVAGGAGGAAGGPGSHFFSMKDLRESLHSGQSPRERGTLRWTAPDLIMNMHGGGGAGAGFGGEGMGALGRGSSFMVSSEDDESEGSGEEGGKGKGKGKSSKAADPFHAALAAEQKKGAGAASGSSSALPSSRALDKRPSATAHSSRSAAADGKGEDESDTEEDMLETLQAADIWATACTVLELLTGSVPWWWLAGDSGEITVHIASTDLRKHLPAWLSEECRDFVCQCLCPDPRERPTAEELLSHPFVRSYGMAVPPPAPPSSLLSPGAASSSSSSSSSAAPSSSLSAYSSNPTGVDWAAVAEAWQEELTALPDASSTEAAARKLYSAVSTVTEVTAARLGAMAATASPPALAAAIAAATQQPVKGGLLQLTLQPRQQLDAASHKMQPLLRLACKQVYKRLQQWYQRCATMDATTPSDAAAALLFLNAWQAATPCACNDTELPVRRHMLLWESSALDNQRQVGLLPISACDYLLSVALLRRIPAPTLQLPHQEQYEELLFAGTAGGSALSQWEASGEAHLFSTSMSALLVIRSLTLALLHHRRAVLQEAEVAAMAASGGPVTGSSIGDTPSTAGVSAAATPSRSFSMDSSRFTSTAAAGGTGGAGGALSNPLSILTQAASHASTLTAASLSAASAGYHLTDEEAAAAVRVLLSLLLQRIASYSSSSGSTCSRSSSAMHMQDGKQQHGIAAAGAGAAAGAASTVGVTGRQPCCFPSHLMGGHPPKGNSSYQAVPQVSVALSWLQAARSSLLLGKCCRAHSEGAGAVAAAGAGKQLSRGTSTAASSASSAAAAAQCNKLFSPYTQALLTECPAVTTPLARQHVWCTELQLMLDSFAALKVTAPSLFQHSAARHSSSSSSSSSVHGSSSGHRGGAGAATVHAAVSAGRDEASLLPLVLSRAEQLLLNRVQWLRDLWWHLSPAVSMAPQLSGLFRRTSTPAEMEAAGLEGGVAAPSLGGLDSASARAPLARTLSNREWLSRTASSRHMESAGKQGEDEDGWSDEDDGIASPSPKKQLHQHIQKLKSSASMGKEAEAEEGEHDSDSSGEEKEDEEGKEGEGAGAEAGAEDSAAAEDDNARRTEVNVLFSMSPHLSEALLKAGVDCLHSNSIAIGAALTALQQKQQHMLQTVTNRRAAAGAAADKKQQQLQLLRQQEQKEQEEEVALLSSAITAPIDTVLSPQAFPFREVTAASIVPWQAHSYAELSELAYAICDYSPTEGSDSESSTTLPLHLHEVVRILLRDSSGWWCVQKLSRDKPFKGKARKDSAAGGATGIAAGAGGAAGVGAGSKLAAGGVTGDAEELEEGWVPSSFLLPVRV